MLGSLQNTVADLKTDLSSDSLKEHRTRLESTTSTRALICHVTSQTSKTQENLADVPDLLLENTRESGAGQVMKMLWRQ